MERNNNSDKEQHQSTYQHEREQARQSGLPRRSHSNILHNCYPPFLEYLPFCPIPWPTENYLYLDLLKELSSENDLRYKLPKTNEIYRLKLMEELHKINCAQDLHCCFVDSYITETRRRMCSRRRCSFYRQGLKCNSCSCSLLKEKVDGLLPTYNQCQSHNCIDFNPVLNNAHCHQCQCNCPQHKSPYCSECPSTVPKDPATLFIPERESPQTYHKENLSKNIIKEHTSLVQQAESPDNSNSEKQLIENHYKPEGEMNQNQNNSEHTSKTFIYSESVGEYLPNYMRGTGDKTSVSSMTKLTVKHTSKQPLPQSTAYFLPF